MWRAGLRPGVAGGVRASALGRVSTAEIDGGTGAPRGGTTGLFGATGQYAVAYLTSRSGDLAHCSAKQVTGESSRTVLT